MITALYDKQQPLCVSFPPYVQPPSTTASSRCVHLGQNSYCHGFTLTVTLKWLINSGRGRDAFMNVLQLLAACSKERRALEDCISILSVQ